MQYDLFENKFLLNLIDVTNTVDLNSKEAKDLVLIELKKNKSNISYDINQDKIFYTSKNLQKKDIEPILTQFAKDMIFELKRTALQNAYNHKLIDKNENNEYVFVWSKEKLSKSQNEILNEMLSQKESTETNIVLNKIDDENFITSTLKQSKNIHIILKLFGDEDANNLTKSVKGIKELCKILDNKDSNDEQAKKISKLQLYNHKNQPIPEDKLEKIAKRTLHLLSKNDFVTFLLNMAIMIGFYKDTKALKSAATEFNSSIKAITSGINLS